MSKQKTLVKCTRNYIFPLFPSFSWKWFYIKLNLRKMLLYDSESFSHIYLMLLQDNKTYYKSEIIENWLWLLLYVKFIIFILAFRLNLSSRDKSRLWCFAMSTSPGKRLNIYSKLITANKPFTFLFPSTEWILSLNYEYVQHHYEKVKKW
jgi:hypothetical protein